MPGSKAAGAAFLKERVESEERVCAAMIFALFVSLDKLNKDITHIADIHSLQILKKRWKKRGRD